jgi:hypothetical protein
MEGYTESVAAFQIEFQVPDFDQSKQKLERWDQCLRASIDGVRSGQLAEADALRILTSVIDHIMEVK